jgi:hypothetical protein
MVKLLHSLPVMGGKLSTVQIMSCSVPGCQTVPGDGSEGNTLAEIIRAVSRAMKVDWKKYIREKVARSKYYYCDLYIYVCIELGGRWSIFQSIYGIEYFSSKLARF